MSSKILKLEQLSKFKTLAEGKYQDQAVTLSGFTAATVEGALSELLTKNGAADITWEVLSTPNTGKSKTIRITKGAGTTGETHLDIDFEKEEVRAIVGFVTITESGGKYYDGSTEVTSADGVTGAGVYLKSQELKDGVATGVNKYVDASAVIEYITVGTQTGKAVQITIDANHQITADIAAGSVAKSMLAQGVQDSLALADSALQSHQDISGKKDKQTAVSDPSASGNSLSFIDTISQNANGEIAATKKTVYSASASTAGVGGQAGLMSAADKEKLDDMEYATDADIAALFA